MRGPVRTRPYWVLLARDGDGEAWGVRFGDYVRKVVADELRDYVEQGYMVKNLKILQVSVDLQVEIDRRVKELNRYV